MAKQSGLGDNLYVQGYNLSGDIQSLQEIGGGPAVLDVTAIVKSAMERIGGVRDGRMNVTSFFNPSTDQAHDRFSSLPTTDVILTYCRGTTLGNPAAALNAKQTNYDPTRAQDGALTAVVQGQGQGYGLEWGKQLTAGQRTDTGAANGTGVDFTAASSFGLQAYLHVFAFAGTDVTVKLQESSDNGVGDAWADVTGGGFTQITSTTPQAQRIETTRALAVERYLRVVTATTGGFSSLVFAVMVNKNDTSTVF